MASSHNARDATRASLSMDVLPRLRNLLREAQRQVLNSVDKGSANVMFLASRKHT
jgi:hypothetical protein